jgi:hypothetical protein
MEYTPRQCAAFLTMAAARRRRELSEQLHISALGSQGDSKAIKATLKDLDG